MTIKPRNLIARTFAVLMLFCMLLPICSCSNDPFGTMVPQSISIRQVSPSSPDIRNSSVRFSDVENQVFTLEAEVALKDGSTNKSVAWKYPERGVTVHDSSNGALTFTITDVGTYTFTASATYNGSDSGVSASVTVNVLGALTSLGVRKEGTTAITDSISISMMDDEPVRLIPVFTPEDSTQKDVSWEFSSNDFFTLTEEEYTITDQPNQGEMLNTALITPLAAGSGKITLRSENNPQIYKELNIIVRASATEQETPATSIVFNESNVVLPIGVDNQTTLSVSVTDGYGNAVTTGSVKFESSNPDVVKIVSYVDRQVSIQGLKAGSVLLTATYTTEEGVELMASVNVTTSGAIEHISTDTTYYSFVVGTETGPNDIRLHFDPADTSQKNYTVSIDEPSIASLVESNNPDYVALRILKEGETDVTLTSSDNIDVTYTFTINAVKELSDTDKINKLTIDRTNLAFNPPFAGQGEILSVTTRIYVDNDKEGTTEGDYAVYGLKWESSDEDVATVTDNNDGTATVFPVAPGEATITATSVVGGEELRYQVSCLVTVRGAVESLIPDASKVQVMSGGSYSLNITPYPENAILAEESSGASTGVVTFMMDDNTTASASYKLNGISNTITFTIAGLQPGTTALHVLVDGKELLEVPIAVTAKDDRYLSKLVFDTSSSIIAQDADTVEHTLTAYDQTGEEMDISYENVEYALVENGNTSASLDGSKHVEIWTDGRGHFAFTPKEPGVTTLRAAAIGNTSGVSTAIRIEVGGAAVQEDLADIRINPDKLQIRETYSDKVNVSFIPYSYAENHDLSIDWDVVADDDGKNVSITRQSDESVTVRGDSKGIDVVAGSHGESGKSPMFTVEVVGADEDAYKVVLDKNYLSFDRNQKDPPSVTATVYKNGNPDDSLTVDWKFAAESNRFITKNDNGNTTYVSMSEFEEETGSTYLTAELMVGGEAVASASCFVEVIDSSAAPELRAITTEYSSLMMSMDEGMVEVGYEVVPESLKDDIELGFSYDRNGIVTAEQDAENGIIRIIPLSAGTVNVTVKDSASDISTSIRITVEDYEKPEIANISFDRSSLVMAMDSDGEYLTVTGTDQYGDPISVRGRLGFTVMEEGESKAISDLDLRFIKARETTDGVYVEPDESGIAILRAYVEDDDEVYAECRIEIGGAAVVEGLTALIPSSNYIQVQKGGSAEASINFIPTTFADKGIDWTVTPEAADAVTRYDYVGGNTSRITIHGDDYGKDTYKAASQAVPEKTTQFTVEVVDDAYQIVLDKNYISYDLAAKANPTITATVYKNGTRDMSAEVEWEASDTDNLVTYSASGRIATVILRSDATVGTGTITAKLKDNGNISASCFIEVVDSTSSTKLRSISFENASVNMYAGDIYRMGYSILPENQYDTVTLSFDTGIRDAVKVEQDKENREIVITGLESGSATVNVSAVNSVDQTKVTGRFTVRVNEPIGNPRYIELSQTYIELSQEDMDRTFYVDARLMDYSGNQVTGTDSRIDWEVEKGGERFIIWSSEGSTFSFTPLSAGEVKVTCTFPGLDSETLTITVGTADAVYGKDVAQLIPSTDKVVMKPGSEMDLWVSLAPNGNAKDMDLEWSSDNENVTVESSSADPAVATVSISPDAGEGETANITINGGGLSTTIAVEVKADTTDTVTAVMLDPQVVILDLDAKDLTRFTAKLYEDGELVDANNRIEIDTTDIEDIVDLSNTSTSGVLDIVKKAEGNGWVTFRSTDDSDMTVRAYVDVVRSSTLEKALNSVVLSSSARTMMIGEAYDLTATVVPMSLMEQADKPTFTFESGNDSVAEILSEDGASAKIVSRGTGTTDITVTATYGDVSKSASMKVTVPADAPRITHVELDRNSVALDQFKAEEWTDVTATVMSTSGATSFGVEWNIPAGADNLMEYEVNGNTLSMRPLSAGNVRITAEYNGYTAELNVSTGEEKSVYGEITGLEPSVNGTVQLLRDRSFQVWVTPIGGSIMPELKWEAEGNVTVEQNPYNVNYATVKTGSTDGTGTVTATIEESGVQAVFSFNVSEFGTGEVSAVTVKPSKLVLDLDAKALPQFTATSYIDGEAVDTHSFSWAIDESSAVLDDFADIRSTGNQNATGILSIDTANAEVTTGFVRTYADSAESAYARAVIEVVRSSQIQTTLQDFLMNVPETITMTVGQTKPVKFTAVPSSLTGTTEFSMESEDPESVNVYGNVITALKPTAGSVTITVRAENGMTEKFATIEVSVVDNPAPASYIVIESGNTSNGIIEVANGGNTTATATLYGTDGIAVDGASLIWTVESPSVAKVTLSDNGRSAQIDALVNDSSTKFTVSSGEIEAEGYIIVGDPGDTLLGLIANPSSVTLAVNEKVPFDIIPVPTSVSGKTELTFQKSSNIFDMEENEASGERYIIGLAEGTSKLNVSGDDGVATANTEIDVRVSGVLTPARIQIDRSSVTLTNDVPEVEVSAQIISEEGKLFDGDVTWLVDDESVATLEVDDADPNRVVVSARGAGQTVLKASYQGLMASIPVTYSNIDTNPKSPTGLYALSGQIILDNPDTEIEMGDDPLVTTAEVEIGYTPNNLADEYKTVKWSLTGNSISIDEDAMAAGAYDYKPGDKTTANGRLAITAVDEGETIVRATSTVDPTKWAEVKVTVLPAGVRVEGGIPTLGLDKTRLVLEADGNDSAEVMATLTDQDGVEMVEGYAELDWTLNPENIVVMADVDQKTKSFTSIADKAGKTYLKVAYPVKLTDGSTGLTIDRSIAIESIVTADVGKTLSAVLLDRTEFVMIAGDTEQLEYTLNPNIANASISWLSENGSIAEVDNSGLVTAKAAGTTRITITAKQVLDDGLTITVDDSVKVTVINGVPASSKYRALSVDNSVLSLYKNGSSGFLVYELSNSDGSVNVDDQITRIDVYGINGQEIASYTTDDFTGGADVSEMENEYFRMETVGDRPRSFTVYPKKSGTFSVQAWVLDDPNDETKGGVGATTLLSIAGDVKGAGISTNYIHMAEGDSETINISFNPTNAVVSDGTFDWKVVADGESAGFLTISDQTMTSAIIRANKLGEGKVVYTYTENNDVKTAEVQVLVEDRASLSGGVRKISFPTSYMEIEYPYPSSEHVDATVTFFDDSTTNEDIAYYLSDEKGGNVAEGTYSDIARLTYHENTGVDIVPVGPGTFYLTAACQPVGSDHVYTATMQITVKGAINSLTTSHSKLVLYTGGSTEVSVTPDDTNAPGASYVWNVIEEKTISADGTVIDVPSSARSHKALEEFLIMDTTDSSSVIIGAKDVVTDASAVGYNKNVVDSYPRRVTVEVRAPQYDVSTEIVIDVFLLAAENYYPKALEINVPTTSIDVPDSGSFTQDDRIVVTATVTDRDGAQIDANVDWYFYPIGNDGDSSWWVTERPDSNGDSYKKVSWVDPDNHLANDYIDAYLNEETSELSFIPTQSGQYRLKAIVRENPYLQKSQNIYVGGEVKSVSVTQDESTVNNVSIIKDSSVVLNVAFNPVNALAGDPIWVLRSQKYSTEADKENVNLAKNEYVSFTQTGRSISIRGDKISDGVEGVDSNDLILYCEYYTDAEVRRQLDEAINGTPDKKGDGILSLEEYDTITAGQVPLMWTVNLNVLPKDMTILTFSITDLPESIDPSNVTSAIPFTVTAKATGANPSMEFSNWDWLDVEIVGADSGLVYATTRMIPDPTGALDASGQKKKVVAWQYNIDLERYVNGGGTDIENEFFPSLRYPIAENGSINRNGNRYSFILNPNGVPTEPVNFVVSLNEEYEDGRIEEIRDGQPVQVQVFDPDILSFSETKRLCYIGGKVTSLSAGTTTYNLNNSVQSSEGSNVDMILGASAVLTIEYNPTYTHQKGVIWYAPDNPDYTNFQALKGENTNQCSVFGRDATIANGVVSAETLRAVSIYDPWFDKQASKYEASGLGTAEEWKTTYFRMSNSEHLKPENKQWFSYPTERDLTPGLYYDYQITVQSLADEIKFVSISQGRNMSFNEDGVQVERPGYYTLTDTAKYPPVESVNEIFCYDSAGATNAQDNNNDGLVDNTGGVAAYLVQAEFQPDYGYNMKFQIEDGLQIGYLDDYEIDQGTNQFRFVPNGARLTTDGGIYVNYGDVTISASIPELNIEKSFILHFLPSNIKLVKYIGEEADGSVPDYWQRGVSFEKGAIILGDPAVDDQAAGYWDVYTEKSSEVNASSINIAGLDCIVLYPGEEFDLSAISVFNVDEHNPPQYVANGVKLSEEQVEEKNYAVSYYVSNNPEQTYPVTDYLEFIYEYDDTDHRLELRNANGEFKEPEKEVRNGKTRWVDTDGQSDWYRTAKTTIRAPEDGTQGAICLNWSIAPIKEDVTDPSKPTDEPQDIIDETQRVNGSIWVFISEPVDQMTMQMVQKQAQQDQNASNLSVKLENYTLSLAQLRPPVVYTEEHPEGMEYPSHWFMGEYGYITEGDVGEGGTRYWGTAFLSFSQSNVSLSKISGDSGNATPLSSIEYSTSDKALVVTRDNLPAAVDIDPYFRTVPQFQYMEIFGPFGLPKLPGVTSLNIVDDGTLIYKYLSEGGSRLNFTSDEMIGARQLEYYRHSGMGTHGRSISVLIPPPNLKELRLPSNNLSCTIQFSAEAKNSMRVLDLSDNPYTSLNISDMHALEHLNLSGIAGMIYEEMQNAGRRRLNVFGCENLRVVNIDNTYFNDVAIEMKEASPEDFYNPRYDVVVSARNDASEDGSAIFQNLETLTLSGSIGILDIQGNSSLTSLIHAKNIHEVTNSRPSNTDQYSYSDGDEDTTWIQQIIIGFPKDSKNVDSEIYGLPADTEKRNDQLIRNEDGVYDYKFVRLAYTGAVRNSLTSTDASGKVVNNKDNIITRQSIYENALYEGAKDTSQVGTGYYLTSTLTDPEPTSLPSLDRLQLVRIGQLTDYYPYKYDTKKRTAVFDLQYVSKFCEAVYLEKFSLEIPYVSFDVMYNGNEGFQKLSIKEIGDFREGLYPNRHAEYGVTGLTPARVSFEDNYLTEVDVGSLFGDLSLKTSSALSGGRDGLEKLTVNHDGVYEQEDVVVAGTLDITNSYLDGFDKIAGGQIAGLVVDGCPNMSSLDIRAGSSSQFHELRTFSADGSGLKSIFVSETAKMKILSASNTNLSSNLLPNGDPGGSNAFVILGGLEEIYLSSAGLYGKDWRIGKMEYKSSTPAIALSGYSNERYKSMTLNPTEYHDVVFGSPYYYTYSSDDSTTTKYSVPVSKTVKSDTSNKRIDWMEWLVDASGSRTLEQLDMSANGIGFRWETGYGSSTWGELADSGMIVGEIRFTVSGWEPNQNYRDLEAKINNGSASSTEEATWELIERYLAGYKTVPGQTGVYWTDDEERHGKSPYSGYFTSRTIDLTEEQYTQIIGGKSWRNYTPGDSYWSNRDDENTSQDGHENDRYSLRFGTLPEGDTITMALFKKYKGGGLLSEASWGRLSIVSVEAPLGEKGKYTVSGGYLLDISINDGANTWEVNLFETGMMGQGMVQVSKDGNPIMPSRVMVNYKHADQDTKAYGHDSHAVIFPFGK